MTLPQGWVQAPLAELASKIGSGATPRGGKEAYSQAGTPLIRSMNVHFRGFEADGLAFIDDAQASALANVEVSADDVLLNITGASIGRVCLAPAELAGARVNQHVCIIRTEGVLPRFIQRFLASPEMQQFILQENYGLTRQALTKGMIEEIGIPIPPEAEQRRIVAKLDALTARLARARAELDRVPVLADRLRDVSLTAAFNGTLIEDGESRSTWRNVPFAEVAEIASNLVDPAGIGELPHIAPNHVASGRPKLLPYKTIAEDGVISGKHRFYPGQIIYSKIRPYLRKVVLVDFDGACSADMYPINALCNSRYMMYWMLSPDFTWLASQQEGRTVLPKINQKALSSIPTPVAPEPVQQAIADQLDMVFARADRMETEAARARALLDRLEAAILAKAFRGELVPQDPKDEPASVLLDRIRAERAAVPKPKRARREAGA